jgi:hypothetical protein
VDVSAATFTGLVEGDDVTVSATGVFSDKNVDTNKTVTLTETNGGDDVGNYTITAQGTTTANITAKALSIGGITASNKVYDGDSSATIDVSAATFTGLVEGDDVTVSATGVFSDKNVDTGKTITLTETNGGDDVGNYSITAQGTTTANITAKALTIGGITAANKTYDGDTSATVDVSAATFTGLVEGDDVTVSATGTFSDKTVDTNKVVTLVESNAGDDVGNYSITAQGTTTANITAKALTIGGITAANKTYDGDTSATVDVSAATFTGLVAGDDVTVSATGVFSDKNVDTNKTVTLTETNGGDDVGNYTITAQGTTTANITAKALSIGGITASNKVYDGDSSATIDVSAATFTGLVAGDDVTVSATGVFSDKNVDTGKTITLTETNGGDDVGNYSITAQGTTTANITAKALTIGGITAANKTYDGDTSATVDVSAATFTGLVEGDDVTVSATGTFSDKTVDTNKVVTLVESNAGDDVGNYSITAQGTTTANITAKALTIGGITAANKTYDGDTSATVDVSAATFTGLVAGDDVTVSATGVFSDKNVDTNKTVTLTETNGGDDVGNYTITAQGTTTANITAKALSIGGITASNKVYDGDSSATIDVSAATFTGLVAGDDVTVSATGVFSDKNVDTGKTITLTETNGGDDVGNYSITAQGTTTANITAKALTIGGITAANKTYDGDTSATVDVSAATFTGLVEGDDVTVSATGTFSDKTVDTNKVVTLVESNAGDDVGNYSITAQGTTTANITAKALTIGGITAANKTYDGDTSATVDVSAATFTGLVAGDDVTVSATGVFSDKNVDTNKTVTLTETNGGDDVGNYTITAQGTTTANITAKALSIGGITASNKVYDGDSSATIDVSAATFTGLVAGDDVTVSATGVFSDKNVDTGKTITLN